MSMHTKKVRLFADLYPGWQDSSFPVVFFSPSCEPRLPTGAALRVSVEVELPCIGGSAIAESVPASPVRIEPNVGSQPRGQNADKLSP